MRDLTYFLAIVVAVLLAYQAKPHPRPHAFRIAKVKLNDADLTVCVFTAVLALLVAAMALAIW